ncbi:hypothetical protein BACCIP111883_00934 [Sutcliffiella rhizosphaerae]|uniref:Uncharacterized protein n=1 Tax=Sutcliffiella rhizosphaerae TaxID=2880967 RepID=A0ABN8A8P4_9BACI|nr:hypothetical protein BACCIP111883_00934 [Sutcliffiella rhizosphaerae]
MEKGCSLEVNGNPLEIPGMSFLKNRKRAPFKSRMKPISRAAPMFSGLISFIDEQVDFSTEPRQLSTAARIFRRNHGSYRQSLGFIDENMPDIDEVT